MSNTPLVKTIDLPSPRAPRTRPNASLFDTDFDAAVERPGMIGTVDADVSNQRLHSEGVEQAVIIVRIAVGLLRRQIETRGTFDKVEPIEREHDRSVAFNLG